MTKLFKGYKGWLNGSMAYTALGENALEPGLQFPVFQVNKEGHFLAGPGTFRYFGDFWKRRLSLNF